MTTNNKLKVAIVGGGSWATALVKLFCNNLSKVGWWMRNEEAIEHILQFKHNPRYLQSIEFDTAKLSLSSNLIETIQNAEIIVIATPSAFLTALFKDIPEGLLSDKIVFPIADTTTSISSSGNKDIISATFLIAAASFTDAPPNLKTFILLVYNDKNKDSEYEL